MATMIIKTFFAKTWGQGIAEKLSPTAAGAESALSGRGLRPRRKRYLSKEWNGKEGAL